MSPPTPREPETLSQSTTRTWSVRGPWTPSTRSSSMSLVAEGPLIQVSGRVASRTANASGTSATTWPASTTQTTGQSSNDPKIQEMNQKAKDKVEREGK